MRGRVAVLCGVVVVLSGCTPALAPLAPGVRVEVGVPRVGTDPDGYQAYCVTVAAHNEGMRTARNVIVTGVPCDGGAIFPRHAGWDSVHVGDLLPGARTGERELWSRPRTRGRPRTDCPWGVTATVDGEEDGG